MQKIIQWLGPLLLNFFWDKLVLAFGYLKEQYDIKTGKKKIIEAGQEEVKEINELEKLEEATRNLLNGSGDTRNK
jgi:hypothetical protein